MQVANGRVGPGMTTILNLVEQQGSRAGFQRKRTTLRTTLKKTWFIEQIKAAIFLKAVEATEAM